MPSRLCALPRGEILQRLANFRLEYETIKQSGLTLDMSRGKPAAEQLDLSNDLLLALSRGEDCLSGGRDCRNYGSFEIPEAVTLFSSLLGVRENELLLGGNSSLHLLYDAVCRLLLFGAPDGHAPWLGQNVKFLAPVPGYDRHFALCEALHIELIPVPLTGGGPDMDVVEALVADPEMRGILCVPKYSNPSGETYSPDCVRRLAALRPAAADFRIFWDLAYLLHDLYETGDPLLNIFDLVRGTENENMVLGFFSTSKITFAGSGISMLVASPENLRFAREKIALQTISPDKLNILRHARFLKDAERVKDLMKKHAALLRPKFETVRRIFSEEGDDSFRLSDPRGGYFLLLTVKNGTAARTVALCREAGLLLTPAGATHPHFLDPDDKYIRIAPSFPPQNELESAARLLVLAAKIALCERLLCEI